RPSSIRDRLLIKCTLLNSLLTDTNDYFHSPMFFTFILRQPPRYKLFPYTTLFRSAQLLTKQEWTKLSNISKLVKMKEQNYKTAVMNYLVKSMKVAYSLSLMYLQIQQSICVFSKRKSMDQLFL